jgi:WD40 repeat protein
MARPTPPPAIAQQQQALSLPQHQQYVQELGGSGNQLVDLAVETLPSNLKREGEDWYAVFNPRVRRTLDVELVHNLAHQSVVCCVRFSRDGRFVATGCNRSAQIFDVESGQQVKHLQDTSLPQDGDLYIRSVCFSPDGQYLATGAEDKIIRVRTIVPMNLDYLLTHDSRFGKSPLVRSVIHLLVTSKTSILWITLLMVATLHLVLAIAPSVFGTFLTTSVFFA